MMKKLLLVDDDKNLCEIFKQGLSNQFEITTTDDADIAYRIATKNPQDIILLDLHLKDGDGIELCERLRKNQMTKRLPILIFTGFGSPEKMLSSYSVGADDFIDKPVDLQVLATRLNARLQRCRDISSGATVDFGNMKLNSDSHEFEIDGKVTSLTEIEFELLRMFLTNPNKKITREEILHTIWQDVKVTERTVDVHVSMLRRKLKNFNHTIKSIYGSGYILRPIKKIGLRSAG